MATTVRFSTDLILYDVKSTGKEIGRGAYGRVFEVDYQGTLCAAKEIHALLLEYSQAEGHHDHKIITDFLNECQIWSTIRHPCVVQFLGVYYPARDQHSLPIIVMEKMQCSLRDLMTNFSDIPLNVKLSILDDVCLGLQYLHGRKPPILHRDLTPNNILLGGQLKAKITDLGVAKVMQTGSRKSITKIPGTPDFMPPEALSNQPAYDASLDIFSYGGVILSVITQQWPEPSDQAQFNNQTDLWEMVSEARRRKKYLDMLTGTAEKLKPLVISCLSDNPGKRLSVTQVSTEIKKVKDFCSRCTGHDGISPLVWWADVSSSQQITKLRKSNDELKERVANLVIENSKLKTKVDLLTAEVDDLANLGIENSKLKTKINLLTAEVDDFKMKNDGLETENTQFKAKDDHHTKSDLIEDIPPPLPPRSSSKEQLFNIRWKQGAPAPIDRAYSTAVVYEGKIYVGGGVEANGYPSGKIYIYNSGDNTWNLSPISTSCFYFAMTILNNQLIIAGGIYNYKPIKQVYILDKGWLKGYTEMTVPRCDAAAAGYQGSLIIAGGRDDQGRALDSTELFDSTTQQWYKTGPLPLPHCMLQSVIVDNMLYLLVGFDKSDNPSPAVFTAKLNTLDNHQLTWGSHKDTPRCRSAPVSIMDGSYLLTVGGIIKTQNIATSDIYMLNRNRWEETEQIPSARSGPAVVSSVDDNTLFVFGGIDEKEHFTNTVWIGSCEPLYI